MFQHRLSAALLLRMLLAASLLITVTHAVHPALIDRSLPIVDRLRGHTISYAYVFDGDFERAFINRVPVSPPQGGVLLNVRNNLDSTIKYCHKATYYNSSSYAEERTPDQYCDYIGAVPTLFQKLMADTGALLAPEPTVISDEARALAQSRFGFESAELNEWDACVMAIHLGEVELCIAVMWETSLRRDYSEFVSPMLIGRPSLVVSTQRDADDDWRIFRPFTWTLWYWILGVGVAVACILHLDSVVVSRFARWKARIQDGEREVPVQKTDRNDDTQDAEQENLIQQPTGDGLTQRVKSNVADGNDATDNVLDVTDVKLNEAKEPNTGSMSTLRKWTLIYAPRCVAAFARVTPFYGDTDLPRSTLLINFGWAFLVLIGSATYTANLAAVLTTDGLTPDFATLRQIRAANLKVCLVDGMVNQALVAFPEMSNHVMATHNDMESVAALRAGKCAGIILDPALSKVMVRAENCDLQVVDEALFSIGYSQPVATHLEATLSAWIMRYKNDRTMQQILEATDVFETSACSDDALFSDDSGDRITAHEMKGVFLIVAWCIAAALFGTCVKWCIWAWNPSQTVRDIQDVDDDEAEDESEQPEQEEAATKQSVNSDLLKEIQQLLGSELDRFKTEVKEMIQQKAQADSAQQSEVVDASAE